MTQKYRYSKRNDIGCKHQWGNKTGHDNTQYCDKCRTAWRCEK